MPTSLFLARVRFVVRRTRQRLVGRLWRFPRLVFRPVRSTRDRARSPWAPALVVFGAGLDAASVAAASHERKFAGTNPRYATCTGVVWTRPDRLVVAHKLSRTFVTYSVTTTADAVTVEPLSRTPDLPTVGLITNLAVSPDGHWLVFGDDTFGRVAIHALDPVTGGPCETMAGSVTVPGDRIHHGAVFAPDGRHIVYTSIDRRGGGLRVAPFVGDLATATVTVGPVRVTPNPYTPSSLKGLAFSPDGRWLALSYGANVGVAGTRSRVPGFVEIRPWDAATGEVGPPVARSPQSWKLGCGEDVTWLASGDRILVSDQFDDQALIAACDPATGALGSVVTRIGWAAGGLRAPHGCAQSPDGRWLAITNYGDGSCRFFDTADPAAEGTASTA